MEASPVVLAHSHARNALRETRKSNPIAASEEHELAAGEFAIAAKGTKDPEALRTLKLLEEEHQRLADIIKFQSSHPPAAESLEPREAQENPGPTAQIQRTPEDAPPAKRPASPVLTGSIPPPLIIPQRAPTRDSTSTIASNLASARGIPTVQQRRGSQKLSAAAPRHGTGKGLTLPAKLSGAETQESRAHARGSFASSKKREYDGKGTGSMEIHAPPSENKEQPQTTPFDEGFRRFYSTFERFLSRLSAPLAFGGLPLIAEEPPQQSPHASTAKADPDSTTEPDLTRLFSKAALRALKDDPARGGIPAAAESFYVVPTAGGTISYAGILSRADQDGVGNSRRSLEDEFVDAREHPLAHSCRSSVVTTARAGVQGQSGKTLEELQMENAALKHVTDTLSRRLHAWEANAQSSQLALAQSLRALRPASPTLSEAAAVPSQPPPPLPGQQGDIDARIKDLEAQLKAEKKEMERLGRENDKLSKVVGRYREKWNQLKEGARTRREAKSSAGGSGPGTPTPREGEEGGGSEAAQVEG